MRAAVVVLGDVARSPRMQYHVLALAASGVSVDVVGYVDAPLTGALDSDPRIAIHPLRGRSQRSSGSLPWLLTAASRGLLLIVELLRTLLWRIPAPDVILVQNPPGVPVLALVWLAARLRGARMVIDWHNLTSSMLTLRLGSGHPLVRLVARHEETMGRAADGNLFVSAAMQADLQRRWQLRGTVFRDYPAERFASLANGARKRIRRGLWERLDIPSPAEDCGLLISPTSWTADEDFDLLLEGIDRCDATVAERIREGASFPHVVVLLTGRGPLRERYEQRMAERRECRFHLRTLWLEAGEYPDVLAAADAGLCLHRSTSGLDLPMKAADLFGAGVPVFALDYGPTLRELIHEGVNGWLFATSDQLAALLRATFETYPSDSSFLARLSKGVEASRTIRWRQAWENDARPLLVLESLPKH